MTRPTVSVAVATYNGAKYVEEQLRSIAQQTTPPDEIVVSDDGSTDGTVNRVRSFSEGLGCEVRIIADAGRLGFGQNFGRALAACRGHIIFFADQDDLWLPDKVERVLGSFEGCALVIHDAELAHADLRPSGQTLLERTGKLGLSEDAHIKGCCTAITADLARLSLPIPEDVPHDQWVHALARVNGSRLMIRDVLMLYRIHSSNTSSYAVNSLATVNRRHMLRLRLRALRRGLMGPSTVSSDQLRELAVGRVAERDSGQGAVTS